MFKSLLSIRTFTSTVNVNQLNGIVPLKLKLGKRRIILTQDVPRVGSKGDECYVTKGYARNYLIAKKLALPVVKQLIPRANDAILASTLDSDKPVQEAETKKLQGTVYVLTAAKKFINKHWIFKRECEGIEENIKPKSPLTSEYIALKIFKRTNISVKPENIRIPDEARQMLGKFKIQVKYETVDVEMPISCIKR